MTPGDALKRAADKCRDLVTELDAQEVQLAYQNSHILSEQALLRAGKSCNYAFRLLELYHAIVPLN